MTALLLTLLAAAPKVAGEVDPSQALRAEDTDAR
ncbi:MAG: hypothetical protein ACI8PZ_005304 [Myxococcota bacterium]